MTRSDCPECGGDEFVLPVCGKIRVGILRESRTCVSYVVREFDARIEEINYKARVVECLSCGLEIRVNNDD